VLSIKPLSSLQSFQFSSNLKGLSFRYFKRHYPGDYTLTFHRPLSSFKGFKIKNYSEFILTSNDKLSKFCDLSSFSLKGSTIYGSIKCGSEFLKFSDIDPSPFSKIGKYFEHFDYGGLIVTDTEDQNTKFSFKLLPNNRCHIIFNKNYEDYYLCADINNSLIFVKKEKLSFSENTTNPQDFFYVFSKNSNNILIFKNTEYGNYILLKKDDKIKLVDIIEDNIASYISSPFTLSRNLYQDVDVTLDQSYIKYNNNSTIDEQISDFSQKNNIVLHKPLLSNNYDLIRLKNQLSENDIFSNNNNLLSGEAFSYSDSLREYTSISEDIPEEFTDDLQLNYVYYNKSYIINPGKNTIISPESMYPFEQLNVNDTKFIENGAFSYITPEYADKIYHVSQDLNNSINDQHLLCTWLSGSPMGSEKIWVDRYYYPDRIEKLEALSERSVYADTYTEYIENLISNNINYKDKVDTLKFFDKKSDLVFIPNHVYVYERISKNIFPNLSSRFNYCNTYNENYPSNYFRELNKAGEFTISFYFINDEQSWTLKSERNSIDSGVTIELIDNNLKMYYSLYNPATEQYQNFYTEKNIKPKSNNNFVFSINSKLGYGYVILNNEIITELKIPNYEYFTKQLIYGDFFFIKNNIKKDALKASFEDDTLTNLSINPYYVEPELSFTSGIINSEEVVDTLNISLPCGMRNGVDNINTINAVCSSQFKSNNVKLKIKNTNILDDNIKNNVIEKIKRDSAFILPTNIEIEDIVFEDYK